MNGDPFMKLEDFQQAKQNRERQQIVYPDIRELTDESKRLARSLSVRQTMKRHMRLKVTQQSYDSITHRFRFH